VLPRLNPVPVPPALWGGPVLPPVEVLPGEAVPRLDLIEPQGEHIGTPSHRAVRPPAFRHPVFCPGGPASSPLPGFRPLLLGDLPFEVSERL